MVEPPRTLSHQSRSMTTPLAASDLMPRGMILSGMAACPLASSSLEAAHTHKAEGGRGEELAGNETVAGR